MTEGIYRNLQQRLDKYSVGFPATDSGIELIYMDEYAQIPYEEDRVQ